MIIESKINDYILGLGIDLGTSGVRIAVVNVERELIYSSSLNYQYGLSKYNDWKDNIEYLISKIPNKIKESIVALSIDGTSGTIIASDIYGKPKGDAIPYFKTFSEYNNLIQLKIKKHDLLSFSSLNRLFKLVDLYGSNIIVRHQADWISGWFMGKWELGEETNNFKLGWDPVRKKWPEFYTESPWYRALPKIKPCGCRMGKIDKDIAKRLNLSSNLNVIAGTTDSNAGVIAANPSFEDGVTVLGSTMVVKKFANKPHFHEGVTNHFLEGKWLVGGSSNSGGAVLSKFFSDDEIAQLSKQIIPQENANLNLLPLPFVGERFPINNPKLNPRLTPRPVSDALYLHGIFEGISEIEKKAWAKFEEMGISKPKNIITIGNGSKNIQWQLIREKIIGIPSKRCKSPTAMGVAIIALNNYTKNTYI